MSRPVLLSCEGLTKAYGSRPLFEGLTFTLHEGDHVGLVGPNGAGKSTLLKILAGVETPDDGEYLPRRNTRVGYVPQTPVFNPDHTVEQAVAAALADDEHLDDTEIHQRVSVALSKAGFADKSAPSATLSGGWRARLAIARALVLEPDILLLDEPTNHLDIESILWLEGLLQAEPRAFVVVSHDRYFLDRVAKRMMEISRIYPEGLFSVRGSYADFLEERDAALREQAAYRDSLANLARREIAWLRSGTKARTTKAKSHIKDAHRTIKELAEVQERTEDRRVGLEFASSGRRTKRLWVGEGLRKSFDDRVVIDEFDLILSPGMRLGVVGANGSGKTTLLRMIVGETEPTAGTIKPADDLRTVYFSQNRESLDPNVSLRRALAPEGDTVTHGDRGLHVISLAKRFLFKTEQLETAVSRLSGGERARVVLARMMLKPADLLVLDEPTNDLDIPAIDVLEDSLLGFPGALVLVTHDRYLLDRVSTHILALDGRGNARHFADYNQWETTGRTKATGESKPEKKKSAPTPRKSTIKLSYLEQREWDAMEEKVLAAETLLEEARRAAEDPAIASQSDVLQQRHAELAWHQDEVDRLYARWAELEEKLYPPL